MRGGYGLFVKNMVRTPRFLLVRHSIETKPVLGLYLSLFRLITISMATVQMRRRLGYWEPGKCDHFEATLTGTGPHFITVQFCI
jgi:hypothetical protein